MAEASDRHSDRGDASITVYPDGPLIVRGDVEVRGADGARIDGGRRTVALCRCGMSGRKPFCDGTHVRTGFHAAGGDERETPGPGGSTAESEPH